MLRPGRGAKISSIVIGAWLFFSYACLITLIIGALHAYHFQVSAHKFISEPNAFRAIISTAKQLNDFENQRERLLVEVDLKKQQIRDLREADWEQLLKSSSKTEAPLPSSALSSAKIQLLNKEINRLDQIKNTVEEKANAILSDRMEGALISELQFLNQIGLGFMATLPRITLSLLLTIAMGGLGGLIYITYDFFHMKYGRQDESGNRRHTLTWYLFRPLLGMVAALAVFFLLKAGYLSLSSSPGDQEGMQTMNPFFVAFIGLLSGLMVEQATDRIRHTGAKLFRSNRQKEAERHRWAVGVQRAITEREMDEKDLMSYLDAPEKTVLDWLDQKKPVPPAEQMVISAWLALPKRILFTDIRPKTS